MTEATRQAYDLFAYGTLKDAHVQRSIVGRTISGQPDTLAGYRVFYDRFPVALPSPGASVQGVVLRVSESELQQLDLYEGHTYIRTPVTLVSGLMAWVYLGDQAFYRHLLATEMQQDGKA